MNGKVLRMLVRSADDGKNSSLRIAKEQQGCQRSVMNTKGVLMNTKGAL